MHSILLLVLTAAPFADWTTADRVEVIGFSADGNRIALRIFGESKDRECPGYVDSSGQAFSGSLRIEVLSEDATLAELPIQEADECTPIAKAKANLLAAKAALANLKIDLKAKGSMGAGPQFDLGEAHVTIVNDAQELNDDNVHSLSGTLTLSMKRGKKKREWPAAVYSVSGPGREIAGGSSVSASEGPIFISPNLKVAWVFASTSSSDMRSSRTQYRLLGVVR